MTDFGLAVPRTVHIAITGGPGAGKSTALTHLVHQLRLDGHRVLVAPEAATLVFTGGVHDVTHLAADDRPAFIAVQRAISALQLAFHRQLSSLAADLPEGRAVVLHDRGVPDNAAYLDTTEYAQLLGSAGLDAHAALMLYDAVVHLRSAAVGAEHAYTTANNTARSETADQAAALDARTLAAWSSHPRLSVVDSRDSFEAKLADVLAAVREALAAPAADAA